MGNVAPFVFWLPPTATGLAIVLRTKNFFGPGLFLIIFGQVISLIVLNYTGLFANQRMRQAMTEEFDILKPHFRGLRVFVGFASPHYRGILDPHEDVGFLALTAETLEFIGDQRSLMVKLEDVHRVRFRPNTHSLVGLGRWICVEGVTQEQAFEMRFEPREVGTLLGNRKLGGLIKEKIENWMKREENWMLPVPQGNKSPLE
jgi:hypothetical protein